jgi:hypothetical protein
MGVSAAIGVAALASTFVATNSAAHQATNAHTAQVQAESQANDAVNAANAQQTASQNQAASNTAAAQARVRAIANPDGDSIMTSPLGTVGGPAGQVNGVRSGANDSQKPNTPNLNGPGPTPGQVTAQGKTILGG